MIATLVISSLLENDVGSGPSFQRRWPRRTSFTHPHSWELGWRTWRTNPNTSTLPPPIPLKCQPILQPFGRFTNWSPLSQETASWLRISRYFCSQNPDSIQFLQGGNNNKLYDEIRNELELFSSKETIFQHLWVFCFPLVWGRKCMRKSYNFPDLCICVAMAADMTA